LEQILQANISPRLRGVRFHPVSLQSGGKVLLVRVPKSWTGLHLVKLNDSYRFYSRNSKGKYIMDADEIRSGFVAVETGYERMQKFREHRLEKIRIGDGPLPMQAGPKVVLHLIPFSILDPTIGYDLDLLSGLDAPHPMGCDSFTHQYNFDGKVFFRPLDQGMTNTYVQFFRNGIVEACADNMLDVSKKMLNSYGLEKYLIVALNNYLSRLKMLNVSGPFALGLTVIGAKGWKLHIYTPRYGGPDPVPFEDQKLAVQEIRIDSYGEAPHTVLRPAFDRIWNAAGRDCSAHYAENGEWIADRAQ
jgi:hypothetical protein